MLIACRLATHAVVLWCCFQLVFSFISCCLLRVPGVRGALASTRASDQFSLIGEWNYRFNLATSAAAAAVLSWSQPHPFSALIFMCLQLHSSQSSRPATAAVQVFNLAPVSPEMRAEVTKASYDGLPKYLFAGGALGWLEDRNQSFDCKRTIQQHTKRVTETFDSKSDFSKSRDYLASGAVGLLTEQLSESMDTQYVGSWFDAFLLGSLMWRLPLARPLVRSVLYCTSKCSVNIKRKACELAAECALFLAFDAVLANFDQVTYESNCRFSSSSASIVCPVMSGRVHDSRAKNIFGDNKALCPGRFLVSKCWQAQPKFELQIAQKRRSRERRVWRELREESTLTPRGQYKALLKQGQKHQQTFEHLARMKQWEMQRDALEVILKHGDEKQKPEALNEMIKLVFRSSLINMV